LRFLISKPWVGVDIGSESVKVVALNRKGKRWSLKGVALRKLPPDAIVEGTLMIPSAISEAIRLAADELSLGRAQVVTAIKGRSVILKSIVVPRGESEVVEENIRMEAERSIPFDMADVHFDFQALGPVQEDPTQLRALLVASKRDVVEDVRSLLVEAGLKPIVVDLDVIALINFLELSNGTSPSESVFLANVGAASTNVLMLQKGIPVFTREIPVGGKLYTEELQRRFHLSYEEAEVKKRQGASDVEVKEILGQVSEQVVSEIQRSLDFAPASSREIGIQKVYLTGGGAKTSSLQEALGERMGIPVEVLDPFERLGLDSSLRGEAQGPQFAVAFGLAMRGENR
jgi:type IV pilus assembly protein PilM